MRQIDTNLQTALDHGYHVIGEPVIVAEWMHSKNYDVKITNPNDLDTKNPLWDLQKDYFPITSIADGLRPASGVFQAFVNEASIMPNDIHEQMPQRYYVMSKDRAFKYYASPLKSLNTGNPSADPTITGYQLDKCQIVVEYPEAVYSNKIRATFNLGPEPVEYDLNITYEDTFINVLNLNTDFETEFSPWTSIGGTAIVTSENEHRNTQSAKLTPDGTTETVAIASEQMTVVAGTNYKVQGYFWVTDAIIEKQVSLSISWYNSGGTEISTSSNLVAVDAAKWVFLSNYFTAPAGAVKAVIAAGLVGTPKAEQVIYFDDIKFGTYTPGDVITITAPTVDLVTGKCELWWDGADWIQTQQLDKTLYKKISKLQLNVTSISEPERRLYLIELSAGREIDITKLVESYDITLEIDNPDYVNPVGAVSASTGSISILDDDGSIRNEDPNSPFYGMLSGWAKYRTYVKYDLTDYDGGTVYDQTGSMWADIWTQSSDSEYEIELFDTIKILQTIKCPPLLFENKPIAVIISNILDNLGIVNYQFDPIAYSSSDNVKYFWSDGTDSASDMLTSLCKAYQCALFEDESGIVRLITRSMIANDTDLPLYNFTGETVDGKIANISSFSKKYDIQANDLTINYKKMTANVDAEDVTDFALTSSLWDSSDTVVLRAQPMMRKIQPSGITVTDTAYGGIGENMSLWVPPESAENWPYSGSANVDGEVFTYEGKGYGTWTWTIDADNPSGYWRYWEELVKEDGDQKKWDQRTFNSNPSAASGYSSDPKQQNSYTGRLFVTKRGDGIGELEHSTSFQKGWMSYAFWTQTIPSGATKYISPNIALSGYSQANFQDEVNKPNWGVSQRCWQVQNGQLHVDTTAFGGTDPNWYKLISGTIRDLHSAECRRVGTRFRLNNDKSAMCLILYCNKNGTGYSGGTYVTDPIDANDYYIINIQSTSLEESRKRQFNEINVEHKIGDVCLATPYIEKIDQPNPDDTASLLNTDDPYSGQKPEQGIRYAINTGEWNNVEVVYQETNNNTQSLIKIYMNDSYVGAFKSVTPVKPTGWIGLGVRGATNADFEYFYGVTTESKTSDYPNQKSDFKINQLPAGTGKVYNIPVPGETSPSQILMLGSVGTDAVITSLKLISSTIDGVITTKEAGPLTIPYNRSAFIRLDKYLSNINEIQMTYNSSSEISVCLDVSNQVGMPFEALNLEGHDLEDLYSSLSGGVITNALQSMILHNNTNIKFLTDSTAIPDGTLGIFYDDFGATVREQRDFDEELDNPPAKGIRIYFDNKGALLLSQKYNPMRGQFTLVNASYKDEIINGDEQIDENNTISHTLIVYGYILVDQGDKTLEIKNDDSIRKYGPNATSLDADWIFNEDDAKVLGTWIVRNWGDPMGTIEIETFSNTYSQLGDKVKLVYKNAGINTNYIYMISKVEHSFGDQGFSTPITLVRVK